MTSSTCSLMVHTPRGNAWAYSVSPWSTTLLSKWDWAWWGVCVCKAALFAQWHQLWWSCWGVWQEGQWAYTGCPSLSSESTHGGVACPRLLHYLLVGELFVVFTLIISGVRVCSLCLQKCCITCIPLVFPAADRLPEFKKSGSSEQPQGRTKVLCQAMLAVFNQGRIWWVAKRQSLDARESFEQNRWVGGVTSWFLSLRKAKRVIFRSAFKKAQVSHIFDLLNYLYPAFQIKILQSVTQKGSHGRRMKIIKYWCEVKNLKSISTQTHCSKTVFAC